MPPNCEIEEFINNWDKKQLDLVIYVSGSYKTRVLSSVELYYQQLPKLHLRSDFKNYLSKLC